MARLPTPAPAAAAPPQYNRAGLNVAPGDELDGWRRPPPIEFADGSKLQLYKDGEGLRAAFDAIKEARRSIGLEIYIFADDETGHAFADALCERAAAGVKVHISYDAFGTRVLGPEPAMFRRLRHAGALVKVFHPMRPWECQFGWRPGNRDHRKLLVIDGQAAWLGGLNIANEYAGAWIVPGAGDIEHFWRDNAIMITGPAAEQFTRAFGRTWDYLLRGGRIGRMNLFQNLEAGELGILSVAPTLNSPLRPFLHNLVRNARRSILMTMAYFAPDDPLLDGLRRAARNGLRVRLMLPSRSDIPIVRACGHAFFEMLMSDGVEIHERLGCILHAKTMVIDEETVVIGSTNLDYRSIEYNCELSAVVRSAQLGRQMCEMFDHDVMFSERIDLARWRRRPIRDRMVQWAVSRARYIL